MSVLRLNASPRRALIIAPFVLCGCLVPMSAAAQDGSTQSAGGRPSSGAIVVAIRNSSGAPLTTPALVRLFSADGMPIGQASVVSGGLVTFRNIRPGSYSVDVEASGYSNGHGETLLPMTGEVSVEIYLSSEAKTEPMVLSGPEIPLLVPKAKKEMNAGLEALRRKDLNEAQRHLEKAGQLAPTHPEILYLLGSLYMRMNDLPRSEEFLAKAIQMEPQHAPAQAALGIVLANERKFDAALLPLGKALELDAQSWEARWALSRCYYDQRKFQSALEESRRALHDSNGRAPEIALVVAASLTAMKQYEETAAVLNEFLEQNPDHPGAVRARRWLDHLQQIGKIKQN